MSDAGEMEGDATTSRVRCAQDASRSMNLAVRMQPHLPSLWLPAMPWLALDQSICANCKASGEANALSHRTGRPGREDKQQPPSSQHVHMI